jgi:3-hydroxyacyl-[acyl-carrier-protein] dehydratase
MLKNDLYQIIELQSTDQEVTAEIKLNNNHDIFKGHFPDIPVLPGVTMMQMVKEILEEALNKDLQIKKAGQLKFLQMVNPQKVEHLNFQINWTESEEGIKVKAVLQQQKVVFFKMTGLLA